MVTKEEMKALVGRQILVRVRAHQGPQFFYYFGIVEQLMDYGAKFACLTQFHMNRRLFLFAKKTGVQIKPRTPGFFEFQGGPHIKLGSDFLYYSQFEIVEVSESRW